MTPVGRRPRLNATALAHATTAPTIATLPTPGVEHTFDYWGADFVIETTAGSNRCVQLRPRNVTANAAGLETTKLLELGVHSKLMMDGIGMPEITYAASTAIATVTAPVGANWQRSVWLSDILQAPVSRIPGEYVTWVMGRLLRLCQALHAQSVTNNRIVPQAIAVNQHDHFMLVCDWRSSEHGRVGVVPSPCWGPSALEAIELEQPTYNPPPRFSPELDVAGLVGILQAFIAKTDGNDTVWLSRQLSVLRSMRRKSRPVDHHTVASWYTSATAAYGERRRFNHIVDASSGCFLAGN
jgi:hypothetical protein